jgi:hypothetical protein
MYPTIELTPRLRVYVTRRSSHASEFRLFNHRIRYKSCPVVLSSAYWNTSTLLSSGSVS